MKKLTAFLMTLMLAVFSIGCGDSETTDSGTDVDKGKEGAAEDPAGDAP